MRSGRPMQKPQLPLACGEHVHLPRVVIPSPQSEGSFMRSDVPVQKPRLPLTCGEHEHLSRVVILSPQGEGSFMYCGR